MYIVFEGEDTESRDRLVETVAGFIREMFPDEEVVEVYDSPDPEDRWCVRAEKRGYLIEGEIRPALDRGAIVLGGGSVISDLVEGARQRKLEDVWYQNQFSVENAMPDLVISIGGSDDYKERMDRVFDELFRCHDIHVEFRELTEPSEFNRFAESVDIIKPRVLGREGNINRERAGV